MVLVVEDDTLLRAGARELFVRLGCQVFDAFNAISALTVIADHPEIQLVFSDVRMPGKLDGIGLAHALHEMHPAMRVVLTSADRPTGIDGYEFIPKPWGKPQIARLLNLEPASS